MTVIHLGKKHFCMLLENAMVNSAVASFGTIVIGWAKINTGTQILSTLNVKGLTFNIAIGKLQVNAVISLGIVWEFYLRVKDFPI